MLGVRSIKGGEAEESSRGVAKPSEFEGKSGLFVG
jgi:hypothetical protein